MYLDDKQLNSGALGRRILADPLVSSELAGKADSAATTAALDGKAPKTAWWVGGTANNYIACADSAALDLTGDLTIIVRVNLDSWSALTQEFINKWDGPSGSGRSYTFRTSTTNAKFLQLVIQDSGTASVRTFTSSVAGTFTDATTYWVKVTFDADNGSGGCTTRFYQAADSPTVPTSWTQIGTDVVTATTAAIAVGTFPLVIGSASTATRSMTGKMRRAIVQSGIDGTTVADWSGDTPAARYRDAYGNLWSVTGTANAFMEA